MQVLARGQGGRYWTRTDAENPEIPPSGGENNAFSNAADHREHTKQLALERLEALRIALAALYDASPTPGDLEAIADALTHLAALRRAVSHVAG